MAKKQRREEAIEEKQNGVKANEEVVEQSYSYDRARLTSEVIQQLKLLRSEDSADTLYGLQRDFVKQKTFKEIVHFVCDECIKNNIAPDRLAVVKFVKNIK